MASKLTRLFQFMDTLGIGERDPFGNPIVFKRITMIVMGFLTYSRLRFYNKTIIKGTEYLDELPENGILFLPNHQTYFMDVICLYHIFFSVKWGIKNSINYPIYLFTRCISLIGVSMQRIAFLWLVYSLTESATLVAIGVVSRQLAQVVLSPWAGLLADTLNRKNIIIVTQIIAVLVNVFVGILIIQNQ